MGRLHVEQILDRQTQPGRGPCPRRYSMVQDEGIIHDAVVISGAE